MPNEFLKDYKLECQTSKKWKILFIAHWDIVSSLFCCCFFPYLSFRCFDMFNSTQTFYKLEILFYVKILNTKRPRSNIGKLALCETPSLNIGFSKKMHLGPKMHALLVMYKKLLIFEIWKLPKYLLLMYAAS